MNLSNCNITNIKPSLFVAMVLIVISAAGPTVSAQSDPGGSTYDLSIMQSRGVPAFQIVIFSSDSDRSDLAASQSIVWKSFVDRLKKRKAAPLTAINEVAINPNSDRLRAFELAGQESEKFTIWLQFEMMNFSGASQRSTNRGEDRFVAKFTVFYPGSTDILVQGEIEQESLPSSRIETANNEKVMRDSSGRVINSRPSARLPGGGTTSGSMFIDNDSLARIGSSVADRVFNAAAAKLK